MARPRSVQLSVRNTIRECRTAAGWTQQELAERAAVSRQTINAVETEKYVPSLPLAFALARIFQQPIEQLFFPD
jgi:putative transcriptional regulator